MSASAYEEALDAVFTAATTALHARERVRAAFAAYQTVLDVGASGYMAEDRRAAYLAAHEADIACSKALGALAEASRVWASAAVV